MSTEWERLKSQVNVCADQLLPIELGLDWGQPFEYRNHSVGIITLRWAKLVVLWAERLSFLRPGVGVMTLASFRAAGFTACPCNTGSSAVLAGCS